MSSSADKPKIRPDGQAAGREERRRKIWVPFWLRDETPYEAILLNGRPVFLYLDDEARQFKTCDFIEERDGAIIFPFQRHVHKYGFELVPDALNVPLLKDLYERVFWFVENYYNHYDPRVLRLIALYLMHSYILKRSPGTIFLWLVGPIRTGKTTLLHLAERLGYRAFSGVRTSEAAVYRAIGSEVEYAPMILLREWNESTPYMRDITREADIPGATVPRVEEIDGRREVQFYYVYGSRIVASMKLHGEDADLDRFFIIRALKAPPKRPRSEILNNDPIIEGKLERLRNDLLLWKLANWKTLKIPGVDPKGEILDGRDWEHYGGIIYLASLVGSDVENDVRSLIKEYIAKKEEEEKEFSLLPMLFKIINDLCDEHHKTDSRYRLSTEEIWQKLREECGEVYENGVVVPNKLRGPDGRIITPHAIGKLLREQLQAERERWDEYDEEGKRHRVRGFSWTVETLERLRRSFGPPSEPLKEGGAYTKEPVYTAPHQSPEVNTAGPLGPLGPLFGPPKEGGIYPEEPTLHDDGKILPSNISPPPKEAVQVVQSGPSGPMGQAQYIERDLPKNQYVQGSTSEPALEADLAELVKEGVLVKDGEVGYRCARCSCGPYRASWAIRRHLHVCPGMPIEAAESLPSGFGAFWALIHRDGSEQEPQEEGGG